MLRSEASIQLFNKQLLSILYVLECNLENRENKRLYEITPTLTELTLKTTSRNVIGFMMGVQSWHKCGVTSCSVKMKEKEKQIFAFISDY